MIKMPDLKKMDDNELSELSMRIMDEMVLSDKIVIDLENELESYQKQMMEKIRAEYSHGNELTKALYAVNKEENQRIEAIRARSKAERIEMAC